MHDISLARTLLAAVCSVVYTFGSPDLLSAQPDAGTNSGSWQAGLRLELKEIGRRYCAGDAEGGILQLRVRLTYENAGVTPLILYRGSNAIQELIVSRNKEDLASRHFESRMLLTPVTAESQPISATSRPGSAFVVLQAHHDFKTEAMLPVPFTLTNESGVRVAPGGHVLQVEVSTWPESEELGTTSRRLWRKWGYLWFEPAKSLPMIFEVERTPKIEPCE